MKRDVLALAGYTLLSLLLTWPLAAHFTQAVPGLPGDNWQQYWNVWWVKRALLELHQSPYHTAWLFHPAGADLHLHALNLVPVLLVLPLAVAFGLTAAYNAMALLSFVLGGHGAYRLCLAVAVRGRARRAPTAVHQAAFFGGIVFTFSAYHFFYLQGPLALASVQWLPYFAWQLVEASRRPGARAPLLAGFFFVCAALTDWFHALALLLFTLTFVAWHALGSRYRPALGRIGLVVPGAILVLAPVLVPALAAARAAGRPAEVVVTAASLSADVLGFLVPSPLHPLWRDRWIRVYAGLPGEGALTSFLGFVPLALAVVAAARVGRRVRFWLVGAFVFAMLSLGPVLHVAGRALPPPLPAALFYRVPFADRLRSPGRFVVLASMCLAVVATAALIAILRRARWRRRATGVTAALIASALLENLAAPYPLSRVDAPSLYDSIAQEPRGGALLELPLEASGDVFPERMLHQTRHGRPVVGGYLGYDPSRRDWERLPGFRELGLLEAAVPDVVSTDHPSWAARAVLARYGIDTIVIDKGRAAPEAVARARGVVPALLPGVTLIADDPAVLAYRLPAGAARASSSFLHLEGPEGWLGLEPAVRPAPGFPPRLRWMEERGRLGLHAAEPAVFRIAVRGWAFRRDRRVALFVDGRPVGETVFTPRSARYALPPFAADAGWHEVELRSLDGAEQPSGEGPRRLSVAAAEIRLETVPALARGARVALGAAAADVYVGEGWSQGEGAFRWTDGARATLFVPRATAEAVVLRLKVRPFVDAPRRPRQRLRVEWNGRRVVEMEVHDPTTLAAVLEAGAGPSLDEITLQLPDAASTPTDTRALGLAVEWIGLDAPPVPPPMPMAEALPLPSARAAAYFGRGWSEGEGTHRWTDGLGAGLVLGAGDPAVLRVRLRPFLVPSRLTSQRITVEQEGRRLAEMSLSDARPAVHAIPIARRTAPGVITLVLPDAASPASLGVGSDRRRLGIAGEWLRLDPFPKLGLDSALPLGAGEAAPFLGAGWGEGEGAFRWTTGPSAELFLDVPPHRGALLDLIVHPFVAPPSVPRQRVEVRVADRLLGALDLSAPEVSKHTLLVPEAVLVGASVLRFVLPDAVGPAEEGLGLETRRLGIAVHSLRVRPLPELAPQARLLLGGDEAAAFLGSGWSQGEGELRWTDGPRAELFFDLGAARPRVLQLRLRPLVAPAIPQQRLRLRLNGRDVTTLTLTDPAPAVYAVAMPQDAYTGENLLELLLPDAVAPALAGAGPDTRRLGVAIYWVRFAPWF